MCVKQGQTKSLPDWLFKAPEAQLTDSAGKKIVHHSRGPTWKHVDGSEVTGK